MSSALEPRTAASRPTPSAPRRGARPRRHGGRRIALAATVAALTLTALLAIGILLFGDFGETQLRILGTTGVLAFFGVLALPSGILFDQGRLPALALAGVALSIVGFALTTAAMWNDGPESLGKSATAVTAYALAAAQTSALAARRREQDPASVRRLFLVATVLAVAVASLYAAVMVAEIDSVLVARLIGAAAVLDLLCVALQPVLAAARRATNAYRLRLVVEGGPEVEVTVEASRLAVAAARAIDRAERAGRRVVAIERVDRARS